MWLSLLGDSGSEKREVPEQTCTLTCCRCSLGGHAPGGSLAFIGFLAQPFTGGSGTARVLPGEQ